MDNDMTITLIKHFTITLCCFINYYKILNYELSRAKKAIIFFAAIPISFLMHFISIWPSFRLLFLAIICFIFMALITKTKLDMSVTVTLISMGISNLIYLLLVILIGNLMMLNILFKDENDIRIYIAISITQLLITPLPFKIKKFSRGMPFLQKSSSGWLGIIISNLIIVSYCILGMFNKSSTDEILFMLICFLVICSFSVIYWWRADSKRLYIENIRNRDVETLYDTIDRQLEQMEAVVKSNTDLARRLHRNDEKIKAMEKEISKFKYRILSSSDVALAEDVSVILNRLQEFKEEISVEALKSKTLPTTGVSAIDAMFSHMLDMATADGIILDLIVTGDVGKMIQTVISRGKLETLIGDHVKDAIIAVNSGECDTKNILAHIGFVSGYYEFSVKDNGIEFEIDTLMALGQKAVTTHEKTGGSGWGFMTTFDTMRETKASLIITEYKTGNYSKKVAIRFDGKSEYIVCSYRADELQAKCERPDLRILSDLKSLDNPPQEKNILEVV